jgi:hypothetical protein
MLFNLLLTVSIGIGFIFVGYIPRKEIEDEENEMNIYSFLEELENEHMSNLSEEELLNLKNNEVSLCLEPLLNQTFRMFYDHEKKAFCYYSNRESIYKYLDIVARYYILQYNCKQIYVDLVYSTENIETIITNDMFVSKKNEKKLFNKQLLRFIYCGNQYITKSEIKSKDINILDFLQKPMMQYVE